MSVRWSTSLPNTCSGLIYGSVPITLPVSVFTTVLMSLPIACPSGLVIFASPKSNTFSLAPCRQHQIGRLDVPVRDALAVRFIEGIGNLNADVHDVGSIEGATTDPGGQGLPLHILHSNEVESVGLANLVDVRHIGVTEG